MTFSSTVICSASMKCWWTIPMPLSIASVGEEKRTSSPWIFITPSSAGCMP